jgi:hypothetical protein
MFFKKNLGGSFSVTCVTKLKNGYFTSLIDHFACYKSVTWCYKIQFLLIYNDSSCYKVPNARGGQMFFLKKYTYPFFSTIEKIL